MVFHGFSQYREVRNDIKIRTIPHEDELLTSWIARCALSYGLTPYNLLKFGFDSPKLSILDYDRHISEAYLENLSRYSTLDKQSIKQKTIIQFANKIIDVSGNQPQYLYKDILAKSTNNRASMTYCPECLKSKKYFSIYWRLVLQVGCLEHDILHRDTCPHCNAPIRLELLNAFLKDVSHCYACWRSLYTSKNQKLPDEIKPILKMQKEGVASGWVVFPGNNGMMAPVFFQGIWKLINIFYSKRKGIDYYDKSCGFFGIPSTNHITFNPHWSRFSIEPIMVKVDCLKLISMMLKDWPKVFIAYCHKVGVTKAVLNPHNDHLPDWLHLVAINEIFSLPYWVSDEEVVSALEYMLDNQIGITKMGLARLLGKDESMKLNQRRKQLFERYKRKQL